MKASACSGLTPWAAAWAIHSGIGALLTVSPAGMGSAWAAWLRVELEAVRRVAMDVP